MTLVKTESSIVQIFLILFATFSISSIAAKEISINSLEDVQTMEIFGYMVNITQFSQNQDSNNKSILYYFHGQGGNIDSWKNDVPLLYNFWKQNPEKSPIVISLSLGPEGMALPRTSSPLSGKDEIFVNNLIPQIEQELNISNPYRIIAGRSMGATSAASIFFHFTEHFKKAFFISPGIYPISVHSNESQLKAFVKTFALNELTTSEFITKFIKRRDIRLAGINAVLSIQKRYFRTNDEWNENNIFSLIQDSSSPKSIYLSCGKKDGLGFFPGNRVLAQLASEKGYEIDWNILDGGHSAIDEKSIIDFFYKDSINK